MRSLLVLEIFVRVHSKCCKKLGTKQNKKKIGTYFFDFFFFFFLDFSLSLRPSLILFREIFFVQANIFFLSFFLSFFLLKLAVYFQIVLCLILFFYLSRFHFFSIFSNLKSFCLIPVSHSIVSFLSFSWFSKFLLFLFKPFLPPTNKFSSIRDSYFSRVMFYPQNLPMVWLPVEVNWTPSKAYAS